MFRDEPGLYTGVEHSIPLDKDFRPKRMKEYKINKIDKGIIRRSNSPQSSPLSVF